MAGPSLIATLGANIFPFIQDLENAQSHAKKKGEGIGSAFGEELSSKLKGLIGAAAIEEAIRHTIEYGSKVQDLSNRLGISTTAVQQWDFALKQNGSSIEAAAGFFEKLAVARDKVMKGGEKGEELAGDFKKLGVTIEQLKSSRIEDIAATIAKTFEVGDPQALIGSLRSVGGKAAGELAAAFKDGLGEALEEAPLISPEDIANLDKAADAFGRLKAEIVSGLAPAIAGLADMVGKLFDGLKAAAGIGFGQMTGTIEYIRQNPGTNLMDALAAGKKNASDMYWGAVKDQAAAEDAAKAKEERLKSGRMHAGLGDEEEVETKKEKAHRKKQEDEERALDEKRAKEADRVKKIHEETAEIQRKASMDGMTDEQKRVALAEQIAKLKRERDPYGEATDEELALRDKEIAERESELRKSELNNHATRRDYAASELNKIGGFLGTYAAAPELAMLDVQRKSEQHLAKIEKGIEKLTMTVSNPAEVDDTVF